MTINERKKFENILNVIFLNVTKNKTLSRNKRKILKNLNSMFQLIEIQIIIFKKEVRIIFENFY